MCDHFVTTDSQLLLGCAEFWHTYYHSMLAMHLRQGRTLASPLKDRNLATTDSKHVAAIERFWRLQLAEALRVDPASVGSRRIAFRAHRSKSFDVCWPLTGEPKILISIKSMQNAYRNLTNRIEEAVGDSAVLRLYRKPAVFGFYLFMLDGKVARGVAEQGSTAPGDAGSGRGKGVAPYLELIEEGGDFLQLTDTATQLDSKAGKSRGRQDVVSLAEKSLLDLLADKPTKRGGIHYDAIAFNPVSIKRRKSSPTTKDDWELAFTEVDERLNVREFIDRLLDVARFRGFI